MTIRVVLDTNVVVSAILSPRGASRALLEAARHGRLPLITSTVLLDELEEVLERFVPKVVASEGRSAFEELAEVVEPNVIPQVSEDPDDDHVIAAALAGRADVVATRDGHLLSLGNHGGVVFMDPAACLAVLRDEA